MKLVKIVSGIFLLSGIALIILAIRSEQRATYLANFQKTQEARNARHRKPEPEPEPEPETDLENLTTPNEQKND